MVFAYCIWLLHPPETPLWLPGSVRHLAKVREVGGVLWSCPGKIYQLCIGKKPTQPKKKIPFCLLLSSFVCQQLGPCIRSSEQSSQLLYHWGVPEAEMNPRLWDVPTPPQGWPKEPWVRNLNHKNPLWMVTSGHGPALYTMAADGEL